MSRVFERERREKEGKKRKKGEVERKDISRNISSENMFFFFNERSKRERERDQRESNDDYSKITGDILFELSFFKYFT